MREEIKGFFQSGGVFLGENENSGLLASTTDFLVGKDLAEKRVLGGNLQP